MWTLGSFTSEPFLRIAEGPSERRPKAWNSLCTHLARGVILPELAGPLENPTPDIRTLNAYGKSNRQGRMTPHDNCPDIDEFGTLHFSNRQVSWSGIKTILDTPCLSCTSRAGFERPNLKGLDSVRRDRLLPGATSPSSNHVSEASGCRLHRNEIHNADGSSRYTRQW